MSLHNTVFIVASAHYCRLGFGLFRFQMKQLHSHNFKILFVLTLDIQQYTAGPRCNCNI